MKSTHIRLSGKDRCFNIIMYTVAALLLIIVIYPLYFIVIASFSNPADVANGNVWLIPKNFTLMAYEELLRHAEIWLGYRNTIFYTILGTLIGLAVNIPAAYALSRSDLKGRKLFNAYYIFTMFFNGGLIPTYFTIQDFHLDNTFWVLILPFSVSVYNIIVARTFFASSLPAGIWDAAQVDGCGNLRFFFGIALPLSKAILAVVALWTAVGIWNSYFNALIYIRDDSLKPLQLVIRNCLINNQNLASGDLANATKQNMADMMKYAVIIVSTVPIMCIYPFVQKHFNQGVMLGSVKG